jgi:hypothetical protein
MNSDMQQPALSPVPGVGRGTLVLGCVFILAGLCLALVGLFDFTIGGANYDQSNTWLGLFTAVGGGQILATYALTERGIPEFDFWRIRGVLRGALPRDRRLVALQLPFQAFALIGIALYVMFSPGGYLPTYLLALAVAVIVVCWKTYREGGTGAHVSLYLLAAAMIVRFVRIVVS